MTIKTLKTESQKTLRGLGLTEATNILKKSPDVIAAEKNPFWLIENGKLSIKTKAGKMVPFIPNSVQRRVLTHIKELWKAGKPVRMWILKARQEGVCLDPKTRVLTADLRWIWIDDVVPGQQLVATDEEHNSKSRGRKMRIATVESKRDIRDEAFKIIMSDGRILIATAEHKFLSRRRKKTDTVWRKVKDTVVGDVIRNVTTPWGNSTYEDGWFGGIIDGEGTVRKKDRAGSEMTVSQCPGGVYDRAYDYLFSRNYTFREDLDERLYAEGGKFSNNAVGRLVVGKIDELFRLIGQTRPSRFTNKDWWSGKSLPGNSKERTWVRVVSITPIGLRRMVDLQTSTKTFIAEGFVSHNSTLIEAIIYCFSSQRQNINSFIMADDAKGANYLFDMSKLYHEKLAPEFQHRLAYSNQKKLSFEGRHSEIMVDTADNLEAGRKYTFQFVHLSECAFYRDAKTLMTGLNQAVPELPGTLIVGETTANGVGGYFFDQWQKAKKKETDWIPLFIPWFESDEYTAEVPAGFAPTPEEEVLKTRFKLTDGQISWRKNTIKNKCDGDIDLFNQEYPDNDIDCFLVSGQCRFNTQCLKAMHPISINPGQVGRLLDVKVKGKRNVIFDSNYPQGWLHIWKQPERGKQYLMGSDVAEGLEKGDYSTAEVLDAETLEQCAEIRCHLEPDVFAEELTRLAVYYRNAFMGVERNNHGIAVLQVLKRLYFNLFHMETFAEDTQTRSKKLGWLTTAKSKPLMIAETDRIIREALSLIHSPFLLSELMTYVRLPDGKTEAQEGCFDDLVIAYSIALQMRKFAPLEQQKEEEYVTVMDRQEEASRENYLGR